MNTLQELYCAAQRCGPEKFVGRIFWRSLHRHAVPAALFFNLIHPDYFAMDREFIGLAGRTKTMRQLNEEIRDYLTDYRNQQGLRKNAGLRLSTSRLKKLAGPYLPAMAAERGGV